MVQARDAQTLQWLDAQAFLLRRIKEQFEQQLAKFRLVGAAIMYHVLKQKSTF